MHGNVFQWCADWYDKDYYLHSPDSNPQGGDGGMIRMLRGGSRRDSPAYCRAAFRNGDVPGSHSDDCGFRVCLRQN